MSESVTVQVVENTAALEAFVELQADIWRVTPRNAVPSNIMHGLILGGGLALGAYDGARPVGMSLAFPWRRDDCEKGLWSHMTGVHPDYQRTGVGLRLKLAQRAWALAHGITTIGWTFDLMQRRNAAFNLHRLGVTAAIYHVNLYGDALGAVSAGLPSDRFEVRWLLDDPRVAALAAGEVPPALPVEAFLVERQPDGRLRAEVPGRFDAARYGVAIPYRLGALKGKAPETAQAWLLAVRRASQALFAAGYAAVDFCDGGGRGWVVFERQTTA